MKECKIIHINDGSHRTLTNGNFHYAEDFPWAEKMLEEHLNAGYQIVQMIPEYTPASRTDGLTFYKSGFTVVLIRESREYDAYFEREDWQRLNTDMGYERFTPRDGEDDDEDVEDIHDIVDDMVEQLQIGSDDVPVNEKPTAIDEDALLEELLADSGVDSEEELDALRRAAAEDLFKKYEDEEGGLPFH